MIFHHLYMFTWSYQFFVNLSLFFDYRPVLLMFLFFFCYRSWFSLKISRTSRSEKEFVDLKLNKNDRSSQYCLFISLYIYIYIYTPDTAVHYSILRPATNENFPYGPIWKPRGENHDGDKVENTYQWDVLFSGVMSGDHTHIHIPRT